MQAFRDMKWQPLWRKALELRSGPLRKSRPNILVSSLLNILCRSPTISHRPMNIWYHHPPGSDGHQIAKEYSVNTNKMYTTGTIMVAWCRLRSTSNIPICSFVWCSLQDNGDASLVKPLKQKIWILVAEGDTKAFPGMNAITETLEKNGRRWAALPGTVVPQLPSLLKMWRRWTMRV